MRRVIGFICCALLVPSGIALSFLLGDRYAVEHHSIQRVTPDQLANAMAQDHFYADYRADTLVVSGRASAVDRKGAGALVTFQTAPAQSASCQFDTAMSNLTVGQTITAVSEGARAERAGSGVRLQGCALP